MKVKKDTGQESRAGGFPFLVCAVVLLVIGALIRFWNVGEFPAQIHNDESSSAMDGVIYFMQGQGGWALFGSAFGGHPSLSYWLTAIPSRLAGTLTIETLRVGAALAGTVSLILLAMFTRHAFGRRLALFFLVLIVPYHYHVHFSRTGFPYIHAVLFMALVSLAFALFVKRPTATRSLMTGVAMGLAALVYPATHVLPCAIALAVTVWLLPDLIRKEGGSRGTVRFVKLCLSFVLGFVIAVGPQVIYSYRYGYSSRLTATFVLHEHNIKHLAPQTGVPNVSAAGVVWFNFKRTLRIFYSGDTAEQYQFNEAPLPIWAGILAGLGGIILLARSVRRDPIAIYLLTTVVASIGASTMMVEGNFSPHTILLAPIIPIAMALGLDTLLHFCRLRHVAFASIVALLVGAVWSDWNWNFYNRIVSTERSRLTRGVTYLMRLPIDQRGVKNIVSAAPLDLSFGESYYALVYPQAKQTKLALESSVDQVAEVALRSDGTSILIEDEGAVASLEERLKGAGKQVQIYRYNGLPAAYLVVQ